MSEHLLNNKLDEDFEKMVYPLNLLQYILMQPKYKIINGFVTPNRLRDYLLYLIGPIFITSSGLAKLYFFDFYDNNTLESLAVLDVVFFVASCLIVFGVFVTQSKNNVKLVLKMQNSHRLFKSNDELKKIRKENWIVFTLSISMFLCTFVNNVNCLGRHFHPSEISEFIYIIFLYYFDSNMVFAIRVINFLQHEMKLWLEELYRFQIICSETNHSKLTNYLEEVKLKRKGLFLAYLDIMEAFKLSNKIFKYSILLHSIEVCLHPLMYVQQVIDFGNRTEIFKKISVEAICTGVLPFIWAAKNVTLLICLSAACEQFHLAMTEVVAATAVVRCESVCILDIKILCKNVYRVTLCGGASRGIRAGGVLAVRAMLPLQLLQQLAVYTVVLLQFAFL